MTTLRQSLITIYEIWAGSEGIPIPETAVEAYLLRLIEQMRDEASKALADPQWVGLTDDETQDIVFDNLGVESLTGEKMSVYDAFLLGVKASGAKLKERNT